VAALAPVVFTLVFTPFYLHTIGAARFGVLAICWTIAGAFSFAALGMGPALSYRLALLTTDAPTDRSNHVWTALLISFAASLVGALLVLALAQAYFAHFATLPSGLEAELESALPFLAMLLPLGTLSGVLNGALQGLKRFGALSAVSVLNAAVAATLPLAAAVFVGVELPILILAMVSSGSLVLLTQLAICARVVPLRFPSLLSSEHAKGLLGYGAWMSATALLAPLLLLVDRFVIGFFGGPAEVAVYALAFYVLQGLLLVPASLSSAMLPRLAPLKREQDVRALQSSWLVWLNGILTPVVITAIALAGPFFRTWIGPTLGPAAGPVAAILLVGCWAHGIGHIPSTVVVGRNRPDLLTKLLLACLLPYLLLLYFATARFGVMGAAAAWTVRAAFDPVLFAYTRPRRSDLWLVAASGGLILCAMATALVLSWTSPSYWSLMALLLAIACVQNRNVLISSLGEMRHALSAGIGLFGEARNWGRRRSKQCRDDQRGSPE
jgi:O-antigen/teichoic acid export membrane protein